MKEISWKLPYFEANFSFTKTCAPLNKADLHNFQSFVQTIENNDVGFFKLTDDSAILKKCENLFNQYKKVKHFVHVGIGGSALGAEMLVQALKKDPKITFHFINNIDAEYIEEQLKSINAKEALFYIVSKSGGTAETIAVFCLLQNWLQQQGIKPNDFNQYFVFCTDPSSGDLRELSQLHGYPCLDIPSNIGGRFSVLTAVGLFPALFAGVQIEKLYHGANKIKDYLLEENLEKNFLLQTASAIYQLYKEHHIDQTVLMPYSSKLRDLSFWFVQLWAESLGKRYDTDGNECFEGLTPIPSYGPTDQHSQMQLFMEGPFNKLILLIGLDPQNKNADFPLKNTVQGNSFERLTDFGLNQLLQAELLGTIQALEEAKRPFIHLQWQKRDEETLGSTILLLESLTALMGHYLNIDPFNQPGVESGKKYSYQWLKKLR